MITREDVYEAAAGRWGAKAAVVRWGDRHLIGRWVRLHVAVGDVVLRSERYGHGVEVMGEGESWEEAAHHAGLLGAIAEAAQ